jgi:hypothetical protein
MPQVKPVQITIETAKVDYGRALIMGPSYEVLVPESLETSAELSIERKRLIGAVRTGRAVVLARSWPRTRVPSITE